MLSNPLTTVTVVTILISLAGFGTYFVFLFGILVVRSQSFLRTLRHLVSVVLVHWNMTRSNVCL